MTTLRTVEVSNETETRELAVIQNDQGFWLHDLANDPHGDSLTQIQDDSDTSIMDAIRDNGFEIVNKLRLHITVHNCNHADNLAYNVNGTLVSSTSKFDGTNDLILIDIPGDGEAFADSILETDDNVIDYRIVAQ